MTALRNERPAGEAGGGDPAQAPWSQSEMLAAELVDELRRLRHDYHAAHRAKGTKRPKAPDPIPRPGVTSRDRGQLTAGQYDILYRHINGIPQEPGVRFELIRGGG